MSEMKNILFYFERSTNFKHSIHIDVALVLPGWLYFGSLLAIDFQFVPTILTF